MDTLYCKRICKTTLHTDGKSIPELEDQVRDKIHFIFGTASVLLNIKRKEKTTTKTAFSGPQFNKNSLLQLSSQKELLLVLYLDEHFVDEFEG